MMSMSWILFGICQLCVALGGFAFAALLGGNRCDSDDELVREISSQRRTIATGRSLLREAQRRLLDDLRDTGSCDHEVGVCVCDLQRLAERVDAYLRMPTDLPRRSAE